MKKILLLFPVLLFVVSCGNSSTKSNANSVKTMSDPDIVNVYYFHGKQRCKTCIAVENITKETIESVYADNPNVKYTEINTSDKSFDELVKKYKISWNALIIAKGDNYADITDQVFANAVNQPDNLKELLVKEVNNRL